MSRAGAAKGNVTCVVRDDEKENLIFFSFFISRSPSIQFASLLDENVIIIFPTAPGEGPSKLRLIYATIGMLMMNMNKRKRKKNLLAAVIPPGV